jgi:hypothetical protein
MHVKPCFVNATILIGATGAVTSFVGSAIASVTRTGTGLYTVKFAPNTNFSRLYYAKGAMQSPASGLSGIMAIEIQNAPNASVSLASAGQLSIKTLNSSGVLADPATGSSINVMIVASDSSVLIQGE